MREFKREIRYTVIKHNQLTESQIQYLKNCIFGEGIPTVEAVVIESDWPEFEPVWRMIDDRVSGAPMEGGKAEYDALAAAMTTNQTIDGVPRELLERIARAGIWQNEVKELRALLDLPACKRCNGSGWIDNLRPVGTQAMDCPDCKPSAQPQGEPVAWANGEQLLLCSRSPREVQPNNPMMHNLPRNIAGSALRTEYCDTPLYAEQPAPVAVVLPERKSVNTHNSHDWDEGYTDGWVAYDTALKRLNPSL